MKAIEQIEQAMRSCGEKKADIATKMGWTASGLANRMKNETIDANEWADLAEVMGYDLVMIRKGENNDGFKFKKTESARVRIMAKGYIYDTNRALSVCRTPKAAGCYTELFKDTANGQYFIVLYHDFGDGIGRIIEVGTDDAKKFAEDCGVAKNVISTM